MTPREGVWRMRNRRMVVAVGVLGLVALSAHHPTADIRVLTHDAADPAPRQVQAAIDLGLIGVKLLYTWTGGQLR